MTGESIQVVMNAIKPAVHRFYLYVSNNKRVAYLAVYGKKHKTRNKNLSRIRKDLVRYGSVN